jgi:hypothetical protein
MLTSSLQPDPLETLNDDQIAFRLSSCKRLLITLRPLMNHPVSLNPNLRIR